MTQEAFAARIIGMQDTLFRVSSSILPQLCDREDAVQECIRKAWQKRDKLREEGAMQAWVLRILIHECYDLHKKRRREIPTDSLPEAAAPAGADPLRYETLNALDLPMRLPVVLHHIEGYSVAEIAVMLRLPEGTVKSRLHRARGQLRNLIAAEEVRL